MNVNIKDLASKTPNIGVGAGARSLGICLIFAGTDEQSMRRINPAQSAIVNGKLSNNGSESNEPKKHVNIIKTKSIGSE